MSTKQYKDFAKESKDLFTKNFPAPGLWKIEVKGKGGDREPILSQVNAVESAKVHGIDVDVDYNLKQFNLKTKTNINAAGNIKPKVTYEPCVNHKIEATLNSLSVDSDFELAYEGQFDVAGGVAVHDKVTKKQLTVQGAVPFGNLTVGASIAYAFQNGAIAWGAGVRYADKNLTATVTTAELKTFNTTVYAPVIVAGNKFIASATVDCGQGKFVGAGVVEAPLEAIGLAKSALRVKVTNDLATTVSLITKVAQNWTAVITVNVQNVTKFGVQLTRE